MKIFDTHAHLNLETLCKESKKIILELEKLEIFVNIVGVDYESSKIACEQSLTSKFCFASVGIHPNNANNSSEIEIDKELKLIESLISEKFEKKILCIGETGLDYSKQNTDKQKQIFSLMKHIDLAKKTKKILNLHCREADSDLIKIIKEQNIKPIIHCFSTNLQNAKLYIENGCYLSIPGIVTFEKAIELRHAVKHIPLESILVETDSPYLSPVPFRGKINMPQNTLYIIKEIAKLKEMPEIQVFEKIFDNSLRAFNLSKENL